MERRNAGITEGCDVTVALPIKDLNAFPTFEAEDIEKVVPLGFANADGVFRDLRRRNIETIHAHSRLLSLLTS